MFTRYEHDPHKSASNLAKHRVSFDEAVTVFADPFRSVLRDDQHSLDEERWISIGQSTRGRILFIVYTESDFTVRLIGARVATASERKKHEEAR